MTSRTTLHLLGTALSVTLGASLLAPPAGASTAAAPAAGPAAVSAAQPDRDRGPEDAKRRLDDKARDGDIPQNIASYGIDESTGQVEVWVVGRRNGESDAFMSGTDPDDVRVREGARKPRSFAALVGGGAIYDESDSRCSIGFSARRATTTLVLTAGHCTAGGGTWSGPDRMTIGPAVGSSFPGDDHGAIEVADPDAWEGTAEMRGTASVVGAVPAPVGARTCRSGSTTGLRCGVIEARDQTVNYGQGNVVFGLTRTSACAEPGDSGGPFVSDRQAQGLTSGGSGDCTTGGITFFQPVGEALEAYGATLVTE